ncbi:MAG: hypothetical protein NT069_24725, partial [Planctomycetota bacterium]|nr:hypothetical protein [Planctomycetota bacterium]
HTPGRRSRLCDDGPGVVDTLIATRVPHAKSVWGLTVGSGEAMGEELGAVRRGLTPPRSPDRFVRG